MLNNKKTDQRHCPELIKATTVRPAAGWSGLFFWFVFDVPWHWCALAFWQQQLVTLWFWRPVWMGLCVSICFAALSQINSSICLLRGKIYDAMDNRPLATSSYKEALKLDVYCFEAFDLLTSHHMLTAQEGKAGTLTGWKQRWFRIDCWTSPYILTYLTFT